MINVGLIQVVDTDDLTLSERHDKLFSYAENCLENGADVVLFPEAYQYLYDRDIKGDPKRLDEVSGQWKESLSALAKKYSAYLIPWDYYHEDGKVYNSSYILDRKGEEIGRYKKCNLTYGEMQSGLTRGEEYPVFDTDFGKIGIMICYDNYFPESAACLAAKGAEIIFYPLYGDTWKPQWERKVQTRAFDHSVYIVSCQIGSFHDIAYTGIFSPLGEIEEKLVGDTWKVAAINNKKRIVSSLENDGKTYEYFRDLIHKSRNFKAYAELATEGEKSKEWDEIYLP